MAAAVFIFWLSVAFSGGQPVDYLLAPDKDACEAGVAYARANSPQLQVSDCQRIEVPIPRQTS